MNTTDTLISGGFGDLSGGVFQTIASLAGPSAVRFSNPDSGGYGKLTLYPVIVQVTCVLLGTIGPRWRLQNSSLPGST